MIPEVVITRWSNDAPWPSRDQVEQDLVLSRLICEIANHNLLGDELVFRGGTCLHKLHLQRALRYSEDLDYVRVTAGPIGPVFGAILLTVLPEVLRGLGDLRLVVYGAALTFVVLFMPGGLAQAARVIAEKFGLRRSE